MNLIEIGCALHQDKIFVGRAGRLFEDYLCDLMAMINDSPSSRARIEQMLHDQTTFEHILRFIASHRDRVRVQINPPNL